MDGTEAERRLHTGSVPHMENLDEFSQIVSPKLLADRTGTGGRIISDITSLPC